MKQNNLITCILRNSINICLFVFLENCLNRGAFHMNLTIFQYVYLLDIKFFPNRGLLIVDHI